MCAVVVHIREEELADRRLKGLDRWDEMWEGVLHMTPAPSLEHQRILDDRIECLRPLIRDGQRGTLFSGINVFREARLIPDYRIPDLTFVAAGREHVLRDDASTAKVRTPLSKSARRRMKRTRSFRFTRQSASRK